MSALNVSNVDWNLFLVLHTVLEEGSATKAAKRLHVTQSAVSNALARLRNVLGDPLVVRIGNQLVATPKARALAPRIRVIVAELAHVLEPERAFDPKSSSRRFVLAASDDVELSLLGPLSAALARELPRCTLRVVMTDTSGAAAGLGSGEIDAVVGSIDSVPAGCAAEELFEDDLAVLVGRSSSLSRASAAALGKESCVAVSSSLDVARAIDRDLETRGIRASFAVVVSTFATAAAVLELGPQVLFGPKRALAILGDRHGLRLLSIEVPGEPLSQSLVWHTRADADPAAGRFREIVRAAARAQPTPIAKAPSKPKKRVPAPKRR